MLCGRCYDAACEARARDAQAKLQAQEEVWRDHPVRSLSLWCAGLTVYGSDYEPEDLSGPANNNGSNFVCSS
jgi:hypothetical protein